ncbi:MAG: bifunctional diaminohydroxyphosphoribosylaminopyrimidine deaminase/5-amino-6-(5-phosphoribosylamino)uracil reductase RibD [Bauldia sp.]
MAGPAPDPELDRRIMAAALRIGRHNLGRTWPNPAVGAILVQMEGAGPRIVGRGWTAKGGRPHAEVRALAQAGAEARGATAYVTLEPCSHHGHTPPCSEALVAAGVSRVVVAMVDPDSRVAGRGIAMLEAAGIEVTAGVLEAEARIAHGGHISRVTRGRPWALLKLAVSADGMIGRREGERMLITGKATYDRVQGIRAESDAILVGIGTVVVDDPRLTVRQPGTDEMDPVRVIVDTNARIPLETNLVRTAREIPLWIVAGEGADPARIVALEEAGVRVIRVREGSGGLDISAVFQALGTAGLTRVLVEGGSRIASSLVSNDLADEVILFRASVVVGPGGVRALDGYALSAIERSPRYRLVEESQVGEDQMRRYLRTTT